MKIEKIKKLSGSRYHLLIDNKKHIIYDDVLLAFNLYKPCNITKDNYQKLIDKNSFYEGYYKALKYVSFKMRSEKEVYQKLISLNIAKKEIDNIINKLKADGYVDNIKYTHAFILDQINLTNNGPKKIALELKKRGISDTIIDKEMETIEDTVFIDNASKYIDKKVKINKSGSLEKLKLKLKNDLYNLGYLEKHFTEYLNSINIDEDKNYDKDKLKIEKRLSRKYQGEELELRVKKALYSLGYKM